VDLALIPVADALPTAEVARLLDDCSSTAVTDLELAAMLERFVWVAETLLAYVQRLGTKPSPN